MKKVEDISKLKGFDKLNKEFDNVIHENLDTHQTLELSNNVNKNGIDKVVYLKLNISYKGNGYRGPKECLESAIGDLLPWLDLLLNHDEKSKSSSNNSLSLFGDMDESNDFEEEPEEPTTDNGWSTYFKKRDQVRINNLKKQFKFFELFNELAWCWSYHSINYTIPSNDEVIEIIKNDLDLISKGKVPKRISVGTIDTDCIMSDTEVIHKILNTVEIYFNSFREITGVNYDASYTVFGLPSNSLRQSLFKLEKGNLEVYNCRFHNFFKATPDYLYSTFSNPIVREYDFSKTDLVPFVREKFNIRKKEQITNKEYMLDIACGEAFRSLLWYSRDSFDILKVAFESKNKKVFEAKVNEHLKEYNIVPCNGGGSSFLDELYTYSYGWKKERYLELTLDSGMYAEFFSEEVKDAENDKVVLYSLTYSEFIHRIYDIYKSNTIKAYASKRLLAIGLALNGKDLSALNRFDGSKHAIRSYSLNSSVRSFKDYSDDRRMWCDSDFSYYYSIELNNKTYGFNYRKKDTSIFEFYCKEENLRVQGLENIIESILIDNISSCNTEEKKENTSNSSSAQMTLFDFLGAA